MDYFALCYNCLLGERVKQADILGDLRCMYCQGPLVLVPTEPLLAVVEQGVAIIITPPDDTI